MTSVARMSRPVTLNIHSAPDNFYTEKPGREFKVKFQNFAENSRGRGRQNFDTKSVGRKFFFSDFFLSLFPASLKDFILTGDDFIPVRDLFVVLIEVDNFKHLALGRDGATGTRALTVVS